MQTLKIALSCALLAALGAIAIAMFLLIRTATAVVAAVPVEIQATRGALVSEIELTRGALIGEVHSAREDLLGRTDRQVTALRGDVTADLAQIEEAADRRIGDTLGRMDVALGTVNALRGDLKPTLENTAAITAQAREASVILLRRDALPAQLLGVTAAAKVTLGQTAETMRDIQRATPEIVDNIKATTEASTEASKNTAQVMANFAKATKPLPAWARVVLAIAPPAVQTGATIVTTLALTGK
jgi:ABC-type transporter Mla subunit MlaD